MITINAPDISAQMKALAEKVDAEVSAYARSVALNIQGSVAAATPVDTGRARANWQMSIGAPASGLLEIGGGGAALGRFVASEGKSIWVVNNLPYIVRLNEGWSKTQQPIPGWIERETVIAANAVRKPRI